MMLEHPDITRANLTGYPHGEPEWPKCPICGAECETIFMDEHSEIFACDVCVQKKIAWDCDECF